MTKKELSKLLGYSEEYFHKYFRMAADDSPLGQRLKAKNGKSTMTMVIDYSLDEVLHAVSFIPSFSPMEIQTIKENFITRDILYENRKIKPIKLSSAAKSFLFLNSNCGGNRLVCCTCAYIRMRKINKPGSKFHPFCNLFGAFIDRGKSKRNIYADRCEAFEFSDKPPLILDKNGNIYMEEKQMLPSPAT